MRPATGATPLLALEAVAVDTETSGLDVATARIIQLGAVPVSKGRAEIGAAIDALVAPGIAIPPASTGVHGITDAMVRNAPAFAEVWPSFNGFLAGRVVIGHSIGFDFAVLERECARSGLAWERPRSLCVRLLAKIANPALRDTSLDAIAAWLGIPILGRHSGPGDAAAAAEIFVALLPKLAQRGIRTLAAAERACLDLTSDLEGAHRAGWVEPISPPELPSFQAIDPYAYRHRVGDLMSRPAVVLDGTTRAKDAIALMVDRRISSVFVSDGGQAGGPVGHYGIVTERDMLRRIAARGQEALASQLGEFASRPLASIRAAAFAYRAIGRMERLGIRHLAVRDEDGLLAGVISARDLLRLRASAAIQLDDAIEAATSAAELAAAWATLPSVADALLAEDIKARTIAEIVSEELCAQTRRAAVLAEEAMADEGYGPPPCTYALLVLGSGGRGESLLAADQDNAIVYAEGDPGGPDDAWFARLGAHVADILDAAGVHYCRGGVMARNPQWRGSTAVWKSRIDQWVRRSRPQDLLNVDIFFDLRPVHGDLALGGALFDHAHSVGHEHADFAKLLGEQVDTASPFTFLGGLQLEKGRIDLKKHGLFPIVATARTLAIRHGVRARSTKARLEGLIGLALGGEADLAAMLEDHSVLLSLLLAQQSRDLHLGHSASNRVELAALDKARQARLKDVLKRLQVAPSLVRDLMFG